MINIYLFIYIYSRILREQQNKYVEKLIQHFHMQYRFTMFY
jgi:hypothetical protein